MKREEKKYRLQSIKLERSGVLQSVLNTCTCVSFSVVTCSRAELVELRLSEIHMPNQLPHSRSLSSNVLFKTASTTHPNSLLAK